MTSACGEALLDAADLAVDVDIDIVAEGDALFVQERRARLHRRFRVEHRRQELVVDLEQAAGRFGGGFGFRDDGGDPLADEADDVVEHVGVVGIDEVILVGGGRVEPARHVLPGEDGDDAGHGKRLVALDGLDARMGMRRAQHLQMQRAFRWHVESVARVAGDDRLGERVAQAPATGVAGDILLDIDARHAARRRCCGSRCSGKDCPSARAADPARCLIEGSGRHDHAGGAEAALECLRIEKGLLHRVQLAVSREPLDGRDLVPAARKAGIRQEWNGLPSSQTVQAPQSPGSQPFLTPKKPCSRRKVRRHWPGSRARAGERALPFTREVHACAPGRELGADLLRVMVCEVALVGGEPCTSSK